MWLYNCNLGLWWWFNLGWRWVVYGFNGLLLGRVVRRFRIGVVDGFNRRRIVKWFNRRRIVIGFHWLGLLDRGTSRSRWPTASLHHLQVLAGVGPIHALFVS